MAITWRAAAIRDIEPCLAIQRKLLGDGLVGEDVARKIWKQLVDHPSFLSAVMMADPPIQGHRFVGFGAAVFVSSEFAGAEIAHPRPDINSRLFAGIHSGRPVLLTRRQVGQGNAGSGLDIVILCGIWRDGIVSADERDLIHTLFPVSLTEITAGYQIRRILSESADQPAKEFLDRSIVYRTIADFPELARTIHLMTLESVRAIPASLGNVIFTYNHPTLRLRDSDQELLRLALCGLTDNELCVQLGITVAAVKARWRSAFMRVAETMPALVSDDEDSDDARGKQKRHRVLSYVRSHMEELRPYTWKHTHSSNCCAKAASGSEGKPGPPK